MFRFGFSHFLYVLILIPLLILFFIWAFRQKKKAMEVFGNLALVEKLSGYVSRSRQIWKRIIIIIAVFLLIIAIARPQLGTKMKQIKREGQDIVIALDLSESMIAEDIKPNRLQKAKHEISSLINKFQGDRVALVGFAGKAFVQCPLTLDYSAAKMFLDAMEPDIMPIPGTAIAAAMEKSLSCFDEKERKHKILILITDGEDHIGKPLDAAKLASRQGVVIYTVGIGSRKGVPIPVFDKQGNRTGYKKDRNGEVVMTKLDELTLEKIALETEGKYYRASPGEAELDKIYSDILKMEKKSLSSRQYTQFEDRFQPVIAFVLILLGWELVLSEKKRVKKAWKGRFE
ncbi:MAG: VWA domain-containing protein [bacterium]